MFDFLLFLYVRITIIRVYLGEDVFIFGRGGPFTEEDAARM